MMLRTVCFLSLSCLVVSSAMADPSGRVAQLSSLQGALTLIHPSSGEAQQASLNWPITGDNELVTDNLSRAEIRLGATAIRLGSNTDLTVMQLDDDQLRLRLNHGSLQVHVRNVGPASELTLDIPQGRIGFPGAANVRIDTREDNDVSAINVMAGTPYFDDGISRFAISAGRRAEVDRGGLRVVESRNNFRDDMFDAWIAERDRHDEAAGVARYVSSDITGYQVLNNYGSWRSTTSYGPLWSPTFIPAGWAPYRDGRWIWIAPWGWTWVDNAPWGYAPSHYGRWVFYEQRWCWTPGAISARPVWAPALVGWVNSGGGNYGNYGNYPDGASIGWFPLAPREIYVPAYPATPRYVQRVNDGYPVDRSTWHPTGNAADPRTTTYQNQWVRNATTVLPSYQFGSTVVVTPSSQRGDRASMTGHTTTTATAPALVAPPVGWVSPSLPSSAWSSVSPRPPSAPALRSVQAPAPAPTEPMMRSDRRGVSIAATPAIQTSSAGIAVHPRPTPYPGMATVVVRPAQPAPQRSLPTASPVTAVPAAPSVEHGVLPAGLQKKEEANRLSPDQQHRARLGGNSSLDNTAVHEGFGRGWMQR